jgi:anaerobic ribonucleoside-triphosphate reductase activating protein
VILRLAGVKRDCIVDGPGLRLSIYTQGCSHRCPGCHNPETQDPGGGSPVQIAELLDLIDSCSGLDGITISGGEPFEQSQPVSELASAVFEEGLNLVIYSGYTFEKLLVMSRSDRHIRNILNRSWLLIDGPFILAERDLTIPFRGSRNQRIIDLPGSLQSNRVVQWSPGVSSEPACRAATFQA